jgi:hypothetical protein
VYQSHSNPLSAQELQDLPRQEMDCVDCHNRVTHVFRDPLELLDEALAEGRVDASIPYIKREGAKLLSASYDSREAGIQAMTELEDYYLNEYLAYYQRNQLTVREAVQTLQEIQYRTLFPDMRVTASSYPNNLGHTDSPGCFRCHDGEHVDAAGEAISPGCNLCHSLPAIREGGQALGRAESLARALAQQPALAVPSIAHPVRVVVDCLSCHGEQGERPVPASHAAFEGALCLECHQPAAGLDEASRIAHPLEELEDCLICHGQARFEPAPASHAGWNADSCLLCHPPGGGEWEDQDHEDED